MIADERAIGGALADHRGGSYAEEVFYALGFHQLQAWSERIAAGAWGTRAAALTERLRRALSLSGWPAFGASFEQLVRLLGELGSGQRGEPPESITILSDDVHHGYLARVEWPSSTGMRSTVHQVVSSPFRNPLMPHEGFMQRLAATRLVGRLLGLLAQAARVPAPEVRWRRLEGLDFANQIVTFEYRRRGPAPSRGAGETHPSEAPRPGHAVAAAEACSRRWHQQRTDDPGRPSRVGLRARPAGQRGQAWSRLKSPHRLLPHSDHPSPGTRRGGVDLTSNRSIAEAMDEDVSLDAMRRRQRPVR